MALLLKGGRVVDAAAELDAVLDVLVVDGVIAGVGEELDAPGAEIIDCAEKIILPGLADIHVHLREPGQEYKETIASGTRAAAHGGFTAVACMPNTKPVCDSGSKVRFVVERAAADGVVRVYPIGAITAGQTGEQLAEIGDMIAEGAVAFSDDGHGVQSAGMTRVAMDYVKRFGAPLIAHCEDESLAGDGVVNEGVVSTRMGMRGIPAAAEETMVARDIALAELTGCRLHLAHLSTARSLALVREAKARGTAVTCEVTPHHLFLDEDDLVTYDTNLKMNPPLRTAADREALVAGLLDGTVDAIATDHAPHAVHEKELEFELSPNGTTGLETALSLVNTHLVAKDVLDWAAVTRLMCHGPRAAANLPEMRLEAGFPADITIVDPEARVEVTAEWFESRSRNSAFLGQSLLGRASDVLVGGEWVVRKSKVIA
ncbi:MAG: dihydroorotase [Coriobacteriia bacterium]|nr:dihydroorotase [Coriobacteriia bacterium]MBN2841096.1 dihydroorotase [Coriobacteriia bacterium]